MPINSQKQLIKPRKIKQVEFPPIPDRIYFPIGEVADLCLIKAYVIRFWEQEFPQLRPAKRRCNRRYYQKEQILLIRVIRNLLYQEGFTIEGARARLDAVARITASEHGEQIAGDEGSDCMEVRGDTGCLSENGSVIGDFIGSVRDEAGQISGYSEGKELLLAEKAVEEKIVQVKDKTFLKEIASNIEEILSVLETES